MYNKRIKEKTNVISLNQTTISTPRSGDQISPIKKLILLRVGSANYLR